MYASPALTRLSPEEIRAFIVQRLKAALPGLALSLRHDEPFRLTVSHPDAGDLVLNLGNLVQEVRSVSPTVAEQIVDNFVSLAQRAVEPPEIHLDRVYPGLRHRAFLDAIGHGADDPLIGDGPGDLVTVVLADQGEGLAILNEKALRSAGYATKDVLVAAETNFVGALEDTFCVTSEDGVISLGLRSHPWLGTSLLFVPSLISQAMAEYGWTRALVATPTRETVDLVDADNVRAQKTMETWMQKALSSPRTQSEFVHTFTRGDTDYHKSYLMVEDGLVRLN